MRYKRLNYEQRYSIEKMLKTKTKKKEIALVLGISESTLYRELNRNKRARGSYNAIYANMLAHERQCEGHYKKKFTSSMEKIVIAKLKEKWSPDQIVGWCRLNTIDMVSHERIYQYVWEDKYQGGNLYTHLRTGQKKYRKRYGKQDSRGQIRDKVSIEKRPAVVE